MKDSHLIEIPPLPIKKLSSMKCEYSKLLKAYTQFDDMHRCKKKRETNKDLYRRAKEMIAEVPNCCMLWDLMVKICKLIYFSKSLC